MEKIKKLSLMMIFLFPLLCTTEAQNIERIGDIVEIELSGHQYGTIQWQTSNDKQIWHDIKGENKILLKHVVRESGYYRAKIAQTNCGYFSDKTLIIASPLQEKILFQKDIFKAGDEGYFYFRIPAIIKTSTSRIIAFAEGRKKWGTDAGDIDLVMKYSDDYGFTWSKLQIVWDDNQNTCGNPAPVYDEVNNTIWLLTTWNNGQDDEAKIIEGTSIDGRRVFSLNSTDDGITWSRPKEITSDVKTSEMRWYATGPCHGIQVSDGKFKNRLIIPCDHSMNPVYFSHVIYSDDFGSNWKLGGVVPTMWQNECSIAELKDGKLILSIRNFALIYKGYRTTSYSNDGGLKWTSVKPNPYLIQPNCQGSLLSIKPEVSDNNYKLYSSNPSNKAIRENLIIKISNDDGITWNDSISVYKGPSAYSDMLEISKNSIGIIFENGINHPYEKISYGFVKIQ